MSLYLKDKSHRITLRLNDVQFDFVRSSADMLGVSPSEFLRIVINMTLAKSSVLDEANRFAVMDDYDLQIDDKEGLGRENDKANSNDIV